MHVEPLIVPDAFVVTPRQHADDRGVFLEWFKAEAFQRASGHRMPLGQANCSVSRRGTLRGIHFADVPPGQAKYVQCFAGRILDVIVDIRVGSPTFGSWDAVELDDVDRRGLYIAEGLGHAFCALSEQVTIGYLCSEPYAPTRENGLHPLDPDLRLPWPSSDVVLSPKDAAAPTLAEALEQGLLPDYETCREFVTAAASRLPG
jgi:dTDP-4-dehydrorhamnose 3,5-epimerase